MIIPEEIVCPECELHSCPEVKEETERVTLICFWCDNKVSVLKRPKFRVGKYKAQIIDQCTDMNYLVWLRDNFKCLIPEHYQMIEEIKHRIEELEWMI